MEYQRSETVLELPPRRGNPRNSEGAFTNLSDGRLLFVHTYYYGDSYADEATARLQAWHSDDGGKSWTDVGLVFDPSRFGALNVMSPSFLHGKDGRILMFFSIRYGWHDNRLHLSYSSDDGVSWSDPVPVVTAPGYHVTNNDRVVRLSSGRILVPAAYHRLKSTAFQSRKAFDYRGISFFYWSDDDGLTWHESANFLSLDSRWSKSGLQEPGVVELEPGVVMAWFRTDTGRQYESFSQDNGLSWTPAVASRFTGPCSPLCIKRIPKSDRLIAVWNPMAPASESIEQMAPGWGRTPLVYATSDDNGSSWSSETVIEDDSKSGYCYTAIHVLPDAMLLAYCAGGPDDGICLSRLRVRRFEQPIA